MRNNIGCLELAVEIHPFISTEGTLMYQILKNISVKSVKEEKKFKIFF